MFEIILSPQAAPADDTPPTVAGDVLTYRGIDYDFGPLPEGAEIEVGAPFEGKVHRNGGVIHAKLIYQYNWNTSEDNQPLNWSAYTFNVSAGQCPCPIIRKHVEVLES